MAALATSKKQHILRRWFEHPCQERCLHRRSDTGTLSSSGHLMQESLPRRDGSSGGGMALLCVGVARADICAEHQENHEKVAILVREVTHGRRYIHGRRRTYTT